MYSIVRPHKAPGVDEALQAYRGLQTAVIHCVNGPNCMSEVCTCLYIQPALQPMLHHRHSILRAIYSLWFMAVCCSELYTCIPNVAVEGTSRHTILVVDGVCVCVCVCARACADQRSVGELGSD